MPLLAKLPLLPPHPPLSQSLERILEVESPDRPLTMNRLLERTEGRGLYLVMILLCLPFTTPISLPGVSSLFGGVIMLLALQLALGLPARLPRSIGERPLPPVMKKIIVKGGAKLLRFIEKFCKPRGPSWMAWPPIHSAHALLIFLMALLLALPLPLPFTNTLPAYAIIFTAASMMEEDDRMLWIAYLVILATLVYFALTAGTIVTLSVKYYHRFWHGFQGRS